MLHVPTEFGPLGRVICRGIYVARNASLRHGVVGPTSGLRGGVTGSYVGLACVRHALKFTSILTGALWLVMASVSIGGVGIWLMHFIGMVGFAVPGSLIRYDLALTTASVVLAVMATLFGLCSVVGIRLLSTRRLDHVASCAVGGLVMGLAVSLMHYSGMAAIRIQAPSITIASSLSHP